MTTTAPDDGGEAHGERLHLGPRSRILRHADAGLVKQVRSARPDARRLRRLAREARLTELAGPGIARGIDALRLVDGVPALCLVELPGAVALREWHESRAPDLDRRLRVAAALVRVVGALHDTGITHRDLTPDHVLVLPDDDVRLIGLGSATLEARGRQDPVHPRDLPGTLAFLAPERTGRTGRTHDERADLYAVGVILYELLTGARPFRESDPLALMQAHLGRTPPAPEALTPRLPAAAADALRALLARRQEARPTDPERTARAFEGRPMARATAPEPRFSLPLRVVGRQSERRRLLAVGERVRSGDCAFLVLSGDYGSGKRRLVSTLFSRTESPDQEILTARSWRDDGRRESRPLLAAVAPRLRRLAASRKGTAQLRGIVDSLGALGAVLAAELPLLAVAGATPPPRDLPPRESERRFELACLALLRALASAASPLVLLVEECERLDPVSARLCRLAAGPGGIPHLFIIGTTTDEALARRVLLAGGDGDGPEFLALGPLDAQESAEIVAETLYRDVADVAPLAAHLHPLARGNPRALHRALDDLRRERILRWDAASDRWTWDPQGLSVHLASVDGERAPGGVELLDAAARRTLSAAAAVGERFDLSTLARALDADPTSVMRTLVEALRSDLLVAAADDEGPPDPDPAGDGRPDDALLRAIVDACDVLRLGFARPPLHRALYGALEDSLRADLHERIGRELIASAPRGGPGLRAGVAQLELARRSGALADEPPEALAALCRRAGRSALEDGRPHAAFGHLRAGLARLGERAWTDHGELAAGLVLDAIEAATLCGDGSQVERLARSALEHPLEAALHLRIARPLVRGLFASGRDAEALGIARAALARVGLAPEDAGRRPLAWLALRLLAAGRRLARRLERDRDDDARAPPGNREAADAAAPKVDPEAVGLLQDLAQGSFSGDPRMVLAVLLRLLQTSVDEPRRPQTAFALATIAGASALFGLRGDLLRYAALLDARLEADAAAATPVPTLRARLVRAAYVTPWLRPPSRQVDELETLHRDALAAGDLETAAWAGLGLGGLAGFRGDDVAGAVETQRRIVDSLVLAPEHPARRSLTSFAPWLEALREGPDGAALRALGRRHDAARAGGRAVEAAFSGVLLATLHLLSGRPEAALGALAPATVAGAGRSPGLLGSQWHFVAGLAHLDLARDAPAADARHHRRRARRARRTLEGWVTAGLDHLAQRPLLLAAEGSSQRSAAIAVLESYDSALRAARLHGFAIDEVLVWERASRHCLAGRRHELAARFAAGAVECARRAGVELLADRLEARAADAGPAPFAPAPPPSPQAPTRLLASAIAISSEGHLDGVVATLTERVLEASEAERTALVLRENDGLHLAAIAEARTRTVVHLDGRPLHELTGELPVSLLRRVARQGRPWSCDDALREESLASDPYVQRHRPRAVAVLPLRVGDRDLGVLYAEHRQRSGAFPPARLEIMRLLTSQAAATLESARLTDALTRARDDYRDLFAHAAEGLFRTDLDGRLLVANDALAGALGYDGVEALRADVSHLPRDVAADPEAAAAIVTGVAAGREIRSVEVEAIRRDGTPVWLELSARLVRDVDERPQTIEGSMVDVTARRERRHAEQAREVAEAATAAQRRFLASMSHEIRSPMNAILGFSDLALTRDPAPELHEDLTTIRDAARGLLGIIDDVLDLSRVEAGRIDLARGPVDLRALVDGLRGLFSGRALAAGLTLGLPDGARLVAALPAGTALEGDAGRLRQVLVNLVDNALKFTETGRVDVEMSVDPVDADHRRLRIAVEDTGPGIPHPDRRRLFEAFEQSESGAARRHAGTGLGLTISRELIALMGGALDVDAGRAGGSRFHFTLTLPLGPAPADAPLAIGEGHPLAGRRLLVAEDDAVNGRLARALLESAGASVELVASGAELVERFRSDRHDAVLTDLHMPGMDGIEACRRLRAAPGGRAVPIVAVTADAIGDARQRAREAGFDEIVLKPVDRDALIGALLRFLPPSGETAHGAGAEPRVPGLPDVPGLDVGAALRAHRNDAALLRTLLGTFVEHYGDAADRLRASLAEGREADALRLVHRLHGVAGSFGAERLRRSAAALEARLERGEAGEHPESGTLETLEGALADALTEALDGAERLAAAAHGDAGAERSSVAAPGADSGLSPRRRR